MWAFLRLKDTVVKSILDEAATLEHPQQRVRDNLLLPFSTLATWAIFGVSFPCNGLHPFSQYMWVLAQSTVGQRQPCWSTRSKDFAMICYCLSLGSPSGLSLGQQPRLHALPSAALTGRVE